MGDLQSHARALGRAQRLLDGEVRALVPQPRVRRVDPVSAAAHLAHRDELVLVGAALGRVLETGRVTPRALFERLVEQVAHLRELVGPRGPVFEPDDRQPDLAIRYEAQHVDRGRRLLEPLEVTGGRRPGKRDVVGVPVDRLRREFLVEEREAAEATVPDHLERDALVHRARRTRVDEQREVRVAVNVDEARRRPPCRWRRSHSPPRAPRRPRRCARLGCRRRRRGLRRRCRRRRRRCGSRGRRSSGAPSARASRRRRCAPSERTTP